MVLNIKQTQMRLDIFIFEQLTTILFAIFCAKHDAPAVSRFEYSGVSKEEMAAFHRWNLGIKGAYCFAVSLAHWYDWQEMLFSGVSAALWIWLLFDPVLNISRKPRRPWDYLGMNDRDGRTWNRLFGRAAGKVKAVILAVIAAAAIWYTVRWY